MFKDIPQVICETFWKHLLLSAAIVGFGIIWSVIAGDRILSLLTGTIALLSAVRLVSLYCHCRDHQLGLCRLQRCQPKRDFAYGSDLRHRRS